MITLSLADTQQLADGDNTDDFKFIEASDWVVDGDFQHQSFIIKRISDDTFWEGVVIRSGSPYSDYTYDWDTDFLQVRQVEKVVKEWVPIELDKS